MDTLLFIIITFVIFVSILIITSKVLSIFGLSDNDFLELTYAFRFLYRIFYPIAVFAFVYPKIKYKDWAYIDPLTVCNFVFLTLGIVINNMVEWKYKKTSQRKPFSVSNFRPHELKGMSMLQVFIFFTPIAGIIVIIFLIKKYIL